MSAPTSRVPDVRFLTPDVLIIGAGPSGLTAAADLAQRGRVVLVVEREAAPGGIPRHCAHVGFGIRDLHRVLDGPTYAHRLTEAAERAGAALWTEAMVTEWTPQEGASITSPHGLFVVRPSAVILATGARERPRSARLVPGDRPTGIYTTGQLQNTVHLHHQKVGKRAVILGAELVSWSAVVTLREAGCSTAAMVTPHQRPEAYRPVATIGSRLFRFPLLTEYRVARIIGRPHLEGVEIEHVVTGVRSVLACDTLVTSGDWIPDNELARWGGLAIDSGSKSPVVDTGLRTPRPGVFAIGNLVHPVDTGDVAALDGRRVVQSVEEWLTGKVTTTSATAITPGGSLQWIAPGLLGETTDRPSRSRYLGWVSDYSRFPLVTVRQGGRTLASRRLWWPAVPGRLFRIPASLLRSARSDGGDVSVIVGPHE